MKWKDEGTWSEEFTVYTNLLEATVAFPVFSSWKSNDEVTGFVSAAASTELFVL